MPVAEGHALSIGMFSYRDHMHFGLYSDPEALPDADRLPALLNREVLALAKGRSRGAPYATTSSSRNSFAASTMLRSEGSTSS